jgi:hypothetical protein
MRLLFFSFLFLFSVVHAQIIYSPNTYYVIPPTNGCNGVWAIEDTLHCPVYALNPCFQFDYISGDTLFLKMCSLPCSYTAVDINGNMCVNAFCSYATGFSDNTGKSDFSISYLDDSSILFNFSEDTNSELIFYGLNGNRMASYTFNGKSFVVSTHNLSPGFYIVEWKRSERVQSHKKILIRN